MARHFKNDNSMLKLSRRISSISVYEITTFATVSQNNSEEQKSHSGASGSIDTLTVIFNSLFVTLTLTRQERALRHQ